jgi:hypothetical protein
MGHGSEEGEPSGFPQRDQAGDEQAAEQLARDAHRQEEGWARRYPALTARRHAAARHDHVDVRGWWVSAEPHMERGSDADAGAEMLRVGCNRQHRLGRRAEEQIVDRRLVLRGDVGDLGRQGEEQIGFAFSEPGARGGALTLGASVGCGSYYKRSAGARSLRRP